MKLNNNQDMYAFGKMPYTVYILKRKLLSDMLVIAIEYWYAISLNEVNLKEECHRLFFKSC